jgi:phytoene desaturase
MERGRIYPKCSAEHSTFFCVSPKIKNLKKVIVIGSGFSGLAAACFLAKSGFEVTVLEKNDSPGGRARKFEDKGFVFDMGPSWYWMPDVFDRFFAQFGKKTSDYYELVRLDPSYRVFFGKDDFVDLPTGEKEQEALFESFEKGSAHALRKFLHDAKYKYEVGINEFVFKPSHSILEFAELRLLISAFRLQLFQSMAAHVRKLFKHPKLLKILEFPVLFLGATPQKTPALYSLMNYADMRLGTWYPQKGMFEVIKAMVSLAEELGVSFRFNLEVKKIHIEGGIARKVETTAGVFDSDLVVGSADYQHLDQQVLEKKYRNYNEKYWDSRVMAPSSLLFYLGVNKKIGNLLHHNLFFDEDFNQHAVDIYEKPAWPEKPLFYVSVPSVTDSTLAPAGHENVFILIPLAPGLEDSEEKRDFYFNLVMNRLEKITGQEINKHIIFKRSYAHRDFISDYHAFKGNAYGLANTLLQTAFLKPKLKNKHISNFFFTGQLTTPGPGVPPSLISGEVVAKEIEKYFKS